MYLKSYKELNVWKKSINLAEEVYILTSEFPKTETYGLITQMRRSVVSIPSNIAEGQKRKNLTEYLQFLRIADGSAAELEPQIIIAERLYSKLDYSKVNSLLEEVQKMLNVLIRKLETKKDNLEPKTYKLKANNGFAALTTILIILAISLIFGLAITLLSINEMVMGFKKNFSSQAYYLTNLCAEDSLMKLKENINYQGAETIEIEGGNCQILPIEGNWIIKIIGNYQNQVKKMKIVVNQTDPKMIIQSWEEVPEF